MIKETEFNILHTADWHVCTEFMKDAQACLGFLVEHVQRMRPRPDLIVIPGDIYNHRQIQQETEAARLALHSVRKLSDFAPVVILTGTPSHDGNAPLMLTDMRPRFPILVVDRPSQWVLYQTEVDGLEFVYHFRGIEDFNQFENDATRAKAVISCTPAFTKQHFETGSDIITSNQEIAAAMGSIFANFGSQYLGFINQTDSRQLLPHIQLGHYSVGGAYIHPEQGQRIGNDIEVSVDHLEMAKPSITCLGHIHAMQKIGERTWFSGSLFSTDFGEHEEKGFIVHSLWFVDTDNGEKDWVPESATIIKTPSPKLVKINIDMILHPISDLINDAAENPDNDLLLQSILLKSQKIDIEDDDAWNSIVRMEIKAYQDEAVLIDVEAVKEYFEGLGVRSFDLSIARIPRPNVRSARIMEADQLRDKITFRAEIVGHDLKESILDKADLLQEHTEDGLFELVNIRIKKERSRHEIEEG